MGPTICIYSAVFCESPINPRRFIGTLSDIVTPHSSESGLYTPHTRQTRVAIHAGSSLTLQGSRDVPVRIFVEQPQIKRVGGHWTLHLRIPWLSDVAVDTVRRQEIALECIMGELRRGPVELSWLRPVVLRGAIENPRTKRGGQLADMYMRTLGKPQAVRTPLT